MPPIVSAELRKLASEKKAALDERQKLIDEIAAWQRKVKNMKEAEVERREIHGNKLRQEFSGEKNHLPCVYTLLSVKILLLYISSLKEKLK